MKIQRCPHLGSNREGVSSITYEPMKDFMFEVSNIMRQVRFRFQNIFQRGHASFAMVLTVAKAKATVANCRRLLRRTEAFGGGASKTPALRHQYQYFTQARIDNLRRAGYNGGFTPLEAAVGQYVTGYLDREDRYR